MGPSGGGDRREPAQRAVPDGGSEHPGGGVPRPGSRGDPPGSLPAADHRRDGRGSRRVRRGPDQAGHHGPAPRDLAPRGRVLHDPLAIPGLLQLLPARPAARRRGPDHRDAQRHPQPCPGDLQLPRPADRLPEVGREMVRRPAADAARLAVRRRPDPAHAAQRRAGVRRGQRPAARPGPGLPGEQHGERAGRAVAADHAGRDVPGPLPQGRLLRQPHRLDVRRPAARARALQSLPGRSRDAARRS